MEADDLKKRVFQLELQVRALLAQSEARSTLASGSKIRLESPDGRSALTLSPTGLVVERDGTRRVAVGVARDGTSTVQIGDAEGTCRLKLSVAREGRKGHPHLRLIHHSGKVLRVGVREDGGADVDHEGGVYEVSSLRPRRVNQSPIATEEGLREGEPAALSTADEPQRDTCLNAAETASAEGCVTSLHDVCVGEIAVSEPATCRASEGIAQGTVTPSRIPICARDTVKRQLSMFVDSISVEDSARNCSARTIACCSSLFINRLDSDAPSNASSSDGD